MFTYQGFHEQVLIPYAFYGVWAVCYYIFIFQIWWQFILAKKQITQYQNYENNQPWAREILKKAGPTYGPIYFMVYHLGFYSVSCLFAVVFTQSLMLMKIYLFALTALGIYRAG